MSCWYADGAIGIRAAHRQMATATNTTTITATKTIKKRLL